MRIRKFLHFLEAMELAAAREHSGLEVQVARSFDGKWYFGADGQGKEPTDAQLRCSEAGESQFCAVTKTFLVPCGGLNAVVGFKVGRSPSPTKRERLAALVESTFDAVLHRYDADHDILTSCPNRRSFERDFAAIAGRMAAPSLPAAKSLTGSEEGHLWLISLDIDHFKRLNDRYGHAYGDLALIGFAWVVDEFCQAARVGDFSADLYRLGGEEFSILLFTTRSERAVREFCENLRRHIDTSDIPSDLQIEIISRESPIGVPVPEKQVRKVTCSVGVVRIEAAELRADQKGALSSAKSRADRALYYAKSGGRNCVRFYVDILKQNGSVLHSNLSVGVVAIDLGSEVGCSKGLEFFVVPKGYDGKSPYSIDDGRSSRKLGTFPRLHVARIEVFDVQPEMAFCSVKECGANYKISEGDALELIPLGAFGGLSLAAMRIESERTASARRTSIGSGLKQVRSESAVTLCIEMVGVEEFAKQFGIGVANDHLTKVRAAVEVCLAGRSGVVEFVSLGVLVATVAVPDPESAASIADSVLDAVTRVDDRVDARVGFHWSEVGVDGEDVDARLSNSAARARLAIKFSSGKSAQCFDDEFIERVSAELFDAKRDAEILAFHDQASVLGVRNVSLFNNAGVALYSKGAYREALLRFKEAIETAVDGDFILLRNAALTAQRVGETSYALVCFEKYFEVAGGPEEEANFEFLRPYAYAQYQSWKQGDPNIDLVVLKNRLARSLDASEKWGVTKSAVDAAIEDLSLAD